MPKKDHRKRRKHRHKLTATVRHLGGGLSFEQLVASQSSRTKIDALLGGDGRMSFRVTPKLPVSYQGTAWYTRNCISPDMAFYIDTNFFTGEEKPWELWSALLEKQIIVTPLVWKELQPWLERPFRNRRMRNFMLNARITQNPAICFNRSDLGSYTDLYYLNLLAVRKRMGQIVADEFISEHGREPTAEEFNRLIQSRGADHEFHLLRKGRAEVSKENFFADEQLVVSAVIDALVRGRESTILTADTDVQTQFVKMMRLLDCQYQALLFAERFAADPSPFTVVPMHRTTPELELYFAADGRLVLKPCNPGREFAEWLLPERCSTTSVHCLLFGGVGEDLGFSLVDYEAVNDMARLLEIKSRTGGLNTDRLRGENCHVTGFPVGITEPAKWVVIARDNCVDEGVMRCPLMDIAHANVEKEIPPVP